MSEGPKYPNQQLRSVSLETYFPGRMRVFGVLGDIQAAVEHSFPNLFVPNMQPGEALALRPFQLRDTSQARSLAIAVNQVTFVSFAYPGYDSFSAEAVPLIRTALDMIEPRIMSRVVYRYENEVGLEREPGGSLAFERAMPGVVPEVFKSDAHKGPARAINAAFEHGWEEGGQQGARGFHAWTEDSGGMTVFRMSVFGSVEGCNVAELEQATAKAHEVGESLFEDLISDQFREFISSTNQE